MPRLKSWILLWFQSLCFESRSESNANGRICMLCHSYQNVSSEDRLRLGNDMHGKFKMNSNVKYRLSSPALGTIRITK